MVKHSKTNRSSKAGLSLRVRRCGSAALLRVQLPRAEVALEGLLTSSSSSLSLNSDYSTSGYVEEAIVANNAAPDSKHDGGSITSSPAANSFSSDSTASLSSKANRSTIEANSVAASRCGRYGQELDDSETDESPSKRHDKFVYPALALTPLALSFDSLSFSL
mmetsp:Transcript_5175/g.18950  ORF Transcript_5175/g.18950 Transcript_5175/m.18950 type:complete len:163 (-) Transcript_5175:421-909(-)